MGVRDSLAEAADKIRSMAGDSWYPDAHVRVVDRTTAVSFAIRAADVLTTSRVSIRVELSELPARARTGDARRWRTVMIAERTPTGLVAKGITIMTHPAKLRLNVVLHGLAIGLAGVLAQKSRKTH